MPVKSLNAKKKTSAQTRRIEAILREAFPGARVQAYRYNAAAIRVRVVDARFDGLDRVQREELVLPYIHQLPDSIQTDITMLVLITPKEQTTGKSMVNVEFEHPSPTSL